MQKRKKLIYFGSVLFVCLAIALLQEEKSPAEVVDEVAAKPNILSAASFPVSVKTFRSPDNTCRKAPVVFTKMADPPKSTPIETCDKPQVSKIQHVSLKHSPLSRGSNNTIPIMPDQRVTNQRPFIRPVIALTGGKAFTLQAGESQTFAMIYGSHYNYAADSEPRSSGIWGGFVGAELQLHPNWALQLGLAYYQRGSFSAKGVLTQGPDAQFADAFTYHYNISSRQAVLESKLSMNRYNRFRPYIVGALGESFNQTRDYQVDTLPFMTFSPLFVSHLNKSFTYNLGFGLDFDLTSCLRMGVGYRFADFGRADLGVGHIDDVAISNTLKQSNLYAQEILGQLLLVI